MTRLLGLLLVLVPGTAATRVRDVSADEASLHASRETLARRRADSFAGKVLAGRFHLQQLLQSGGAAAARGNGSRGFPWAGGSPLQDERYASPTRLGRGACGDSWKARDLQLNRTVVIKIAYSIFTGTYSRKGDHEARSADRECKIMQLTATRNSSYPQGRKYLCECLESHALEEEGGEGGVAFIVLEFCGRSLDDLQKPRPVEKGGFSRFKSWVFGDSTEQVERRALSLPEVRKWMLGSLMGLRFMAGMTPPLAHGDVHQGNLVVTEDNEARLIDFGLAGFYPASQQRWKYDVTSWGLIYGHLLCSPDSLMMFGGQERATCAEDKLGIGTEEDWKVVNMAMAPGREPAAINILMAHFP